MRLAGESSQDSTQRGSIVRRVGRKRIRQIPPAPAEDFPDDRTWSSAERHWTESTSEIRPAGCSCPWNDLSVIVPIQRLAASGESHCSLRARRFATPNMIRRGKDFDAIHGGGGDAIELVGPASYAIWAMVWCGSPEGSVRPAEVTKSVRRVGRLRGKGPRSSEVWNWRRARVGGMATTRR